VSTEAVFWHHDNFVSILSQSNLFLVSHALAAIKFFFTIAKKKKKLQETSSFSSSSSSSSLCGSQSFNRVACLFFLYPYELASVKLLARLKFYTSDHLNALSLSSYLNEFSEGW